MYFNAKNLLQMWETNYVEAVTNRSKNAFYLFFLLQLILII